MEVHMAKYLGKHTTQTKTDDYILVAVKSEDLMGITVVEECAKELQGIDRADVVVLDMGKVHLVSSGFLSLLIDLNRTARDAGGKLVLCNIGQEVRTLIDTLRLGALLTICDSLDDAVAALAD